jgi:hypothetical protein
MQLWAQKQTNINRRLLHGSLLSILGVDQAQASIPGCYSSHGLVPYNNIRLKHTHTDRDVDKSSYGYILENFRCIVSHTLRT